MNLREQDISTQRSLSVVHIQLIKTFGSKRLVLSNSYHVHKAQIKTVTSTINMIKKIHDIMHV